MNGTLLKREDGWVISYTYSDQTMNGDLSTDFYPLVKEQQVDFICGLFENKEVEFEFIKDEKGKNQEIVKIIDNKVITWDDIKNRAFELIDGCGCNEAIMVFKWLEANYEVPVEKINKK